MFRMQVTHALRLHGYPGLIVSGLCEGTCRAGDELTIDGHDGCLFRVDGFEMLNIQPFDPDRVSLRLTLVDLVQPGNLEGKVLTAVSGKPARPKAKR